MKLIFLYLLLCSAGLAQTIPGGPGVFNLSGSTGGGGGLGTVTSIPDGSTNGVTWTVATRTTIPTFTFSLGAITPSSIAMGVDPADAGEIRLPNAGIIAWEASPAGTDATLTVNTSEALVFDGAGGLSLIGAATGIATLSGATSGSFIITGVDAMAQNVTFSLAAQTVGPATLSIPDQLGTNRNVVTDTGIQTLSSKKLQQSAALGTDDTYDGITIAGLNAGATIAQWEIVYLGGSSTWLLADANGSGTYPACGMAVAAYSNTNPAIVITRGTVRNDAWAWTPGGRLYMSATPGGLTQTAPSTSGDKVQDVGFALTADIAYVDFDGVYLTVQ